MISKRPDDGDVEELLRGGGRAAWGLAALAVVGAGAGAGDDADTLTRSAQALLGELGLDVDGREPERARGVDAAAALAQAATVAGGGARGWSAHGDAALRAQGESSVAGARAFRTAVLPHMGHLASRLEVPGARMLDVGTGVAALAVAYACAFPHLEVTGIDVLERPLELARDTLLCAGTAVTGRVRLRREDVAELDDPEGFDLAWVPAPFVGEEALRAGLARIAASLRPGGWVMVAHARDDGDPLDRAVDRFRTAAWGGTALDPAQARAALTLAGLDRPSTLVTPADAPAITIATR